jgi:hypothetical protein
VGIKGSNWRVRAKRSKKRLILVVEPIYLPLINQQNKTNKKTKQKQTKTK